MRFVILHNHPEGLVMSQQQRDLLFSTGNVLAARECAIHSLQREFFQGVVVRPLTLLLWGMADRYGVTDDLDGVEWIEVQDWSEAYHLCQEMRPRVQQPDYVHYGRVIQEEG